MAGLLIAPQFCFADQNGAPLAGGLLYTYVVGTATPKTTFQDSAETIANSNPIVLDVRGACVVFGDGDYRLLLTDANGTQIFDLLSSEPLPASAIGAILPCLASQTLQAFRDCAGVTAAINAAVSAISLITGPVGPSITGPTGPQGQIGPTGPALGSFLSRTNPGYWQDASGLILQFGNSATGSSGISQIAFPKAYPTTCVCVVATATNSNGAWWANTYDLTNTNFTVTTSSPYIGGRWIGGPMSVMWIAAGW